MINQALEIVQDPSRQFPKYWLWEGFIVKDEKKKKISRARAHHAGKLISQISAGRVVTSLVEEGDGNCGHGETSQNSRAPAERHMDHFTPS